MATTSGAEANSLPAGTDPVIIGELFDGDSTNATIDDTRIYNRVLTAAEIKQLANLGKATVRP